MEAGKGVNSTQTVIHSKENSSGEQSDGSGRVGSLVSGPPLSRCGADAGMKLCVPFQEAHLQEHEWSTHLGVA